MLTRKHWTCRQLYKKLSNEIHGGKYLPGEGASGRFLHDFNAVTDNNVNICWGKTRARVYDTMQWYCTVFDIQTTSFGNYTPFWLRFGSTARHSLCNGRDISVFFFFLTIVFPTTFRLVYTLTTINKLLGRFEKHSFIVR